MARSYKRVKPVRGVYKNCLTCESKTYVYPSQLKNGEGKYCSWKCHGISLKGKIFSNRTGKKLSLSHKAKWHAALIKGKRNTKVSQETKNKQSDARIGKYTKSYYREMGLKGILKQQNSKAPTGIEKKVYDYLILKGIVFEIQKLINGKFLVDAYIPSLNLVIEADGGYWHSLDRVQKKDKAENAYLTKCGFDVLRLPEENINNGTFIERLVF